MRLRIVFIAVRVATAVNRERVRQMFVVSELVGEGARQRRLIVGAQTNRQGEIRAEIQSAVCAFIEKDAARRLDQVAEIGIGRANER